MSVSAALSKHSHESLPSPSILEANVNHHAVKQSALSATSPLLQERMGQGKPPSLPGRDFQVLSLTGKEESFSSLKYFCVFLIIAAVAVHLFSVCLPAACVLLAVASWYLWSAAIIVLNRAAEGSCFEKQIHMLYAAAMEMNSGVASAALFPFTLFKSYHTAKGNLNGQPILMVNGYLSFGSTWHYQRERLIQAGFGPIYTMNVGTGKSIVTYAKQIEEKVKQIKKETGRNDLILIGHSKGGLVSSYYATHLAEAKNTNVTDVITIASPLAGTPIAYVGPGFDAYEMRSGSPFHQELRQKIKDHPHIRFSHIGSEVDEVVPLSSALIGDDPSRQMTIKDLGHLGLVFSSRVADQICHWLYRS